MIPECWEVGSDFSIPDLVGLPRENEGHFKGGFWHSGRDALRALVGHLRLDRVFFPSYYCQQVAASLRDDGVEVKAYPDDPRDTPADLTDMPWGAGDGVVISNTFGLRGPPEFPTEVPVGVVTIEDHTHDPLSRWALNSAADYAFASLRKWLPLPDGAVLWSPRELSLPDPTEILPDHTAITLTKLTGMVLKRQYLQGVFREKSIYREPFAQAESVIGTFRPSGISPIASRLLDVFPLGYWRQLRAANWEALTEEVVNLVSDWGFTLLGAEPDCVPYAVCLVAPDATKREQLIEHLRVNSVYAAVLWPMATAGPDSIDGVRDRDVDLSNRILALPCDHRYTAQDMQMVGRRVVAGMESLSCS